ncbi:pectinesterase family protein [Granulicella sp. dw_53]|uniref:pectinesterase family protein n=1 Tax=Granulicella sp. dw_53 TaxID=2719792 RepID=UPI001BD6B397|nr:pectinesterase family protein [Granulicella sp. dw_53]
MQLRLAAAVLAMACGVAGAKGPAVKTITVGASGAEFTTIQAAVNAAPETGAVIRIRPGVYREVVHVDKPGIQLRGDTDDPAKVELVFGNSAASTCGTGCSATLFVTGKDFFAGMMTIANDYSKTSDVPSQAVAVSVRADRAVFRRVRLLGAQDTLYASSMGCMKEGGECVTGRQFYSDCYIEGHVDFIFGDAKAVFEGCEIRSIAHAAGGYLTAQSNTRTGQDAGYVFNHCKLTADAGMGPVYLGRPWRDYSTVIFLNTEMGAHILPEGWSEWKSAPAPRLPTATYAEFHSSGPGANAAAREPLAKQLSAEEAKRYETKTYLRGADGWDPEKVK